LLTTPGPNAELSCAKTEPGEVETAVRKQCEMSPGYEKQPGIVAMCIKLARQMDKADTEMLSDRYAAKLNVLLSRLGPIKTKSRGRLVAIERMVGRNRNTQGRAAN
jgi:hypothetical protein